MPDSGPAPTARSGPRRPGRPQKGEDEDVRARLIQAATELCTQRGFAEVGVREVAAAAGVTPAMVSYYFGDKLGLYEAMLDSVFEGLIGRVRQLARQVASDAPTEEDGALTFVRMHIATLAHDPWLPQLVLREVLGADGPLRQRFIERFARQMTEAVPELVREGIASGRLRADLDPELTVLSMMGLCVFPYLSHAVSGPLLGIELTDEFRDRLTEHTVRLLERGIAVPREKP